MEHPERLADRPASCAIAVQGAQMICSHQPRDTMLATGLAGLLLPGERKSVEPMAARIDPRNVRFAASVDASHCSHGSHGTRKKS